jgi:hexosaminidase
MEIHDRPDFPVRGVMLDISRDKVPTMETLRGLIRKFAGWKLNQLQLYTEHTFAYRGHEKVWRGASPMTPRQIRSLDRYCSLNGIELVPNQNSFGHMERWLKHEPYRALAETTGPWKLKSGVIRDKAATLNPLDPGSLRLMRDLYDQLLPNFSSRLFNVGCDETFELGQGKSGAVCRRRGVGNVYVDYLVKIHKEVVHRKHTMMFWSDIVHEHPETIPRLPKDAIALVWGYEADHPFAKQCAELRRAGLSFYVCPGTSSWCSFAGRTENALANLRNAAQAGMKHGARGYLITDWGDYGHRQYLPASYPGLLYGAAASWCGKSNQNIDVTAALAQHAFSVADPKWVLELGRVPEVAKVWLKNRTILFSVMEEPLENMPSLDRLSVKAVSRLEQWLLRIDNRASRDLPANFETFEAGTELGEIFGTILVLRHAIWRARLAWLIRHGGGKLTPSIIAAADSLVEDIYKFMMTHRDLWLARNRSGGLASSLAYYERNLREYLQIVGQRKRGVRKRNSISTME